MDDEDAGEGVGTKGVAGRASRPSLNGAEVERPLAGLRRVPREPLGGAATPSHQVRGPTTMTSTGCRPYGMPISARIFTRRSNCHASRSCGFAVSSTFGSFEHSAAEMV